MFVNYQISRLYFEIFEVFHEAPFPKSLTNKENERFKQKISKRVQTCPKISTTLPVYYIIKKR